MLRGRMTSPAPPSSSSFSHSTPALAHRHASFDASSSSPPTDVIATPSDRHDAPNRSKNGKQQTRRSVRIRTSSSGHFDSSPQVLRDDGGGAPFSSADTENELLRVHAAQGRSLRGAASVAGQGMRQQTRTPRVAVPSRGAGPTQESLDALAQAQAHGITPDQFEAAKQQIMRFLRDEAANNGGNHVQPPPPPLAHAVDLQAFAAPSLARVHTHASVSPVISSATVDAVETPVAAELPYRTALSRTPTASSQLQAAFDFDASRSASRPRPRSNFDDIVGRSIKRQKRESFGASAAASAPSAATAAKAAAGSAVLQWAQEDSSSSSSDDEGSMLASILTARRSGVPSPGLGAPSPATAPTSDTNASPSIPSQRGMMDRFMSTQPAHVAAAPEATVPQLDLQISEEPAPPPAHPAAAPCSASEPDLDSELAPPVSPARRRAAAYPAHVLQSPAPSKPPASILFSPDVARLLRSELDELEANAIAGRQSTSPSKLGERRIDNNMHQSSPSQRNSSPLSGPGTNRTRDVFSGSQDLSGGGGKRTRWSNLGSHADAAPTSPTPSSASYSMRAPSFCDSSPAASERGSAPSRVLSLSNSAEAPLHPASAPDFLYGGPPSSSPTSSHHSEFVPHRFSRSSPGPQPALARSDSMSSAGESASVGRGKRTAARRDTAPIQSTLVYQGTMNKPPYSYAALIGQALFSTPDLRMALADIYTWIMQKYPYFRKEDSGWQNSIRHNLSLNQCFIKTQRGPQNPGKGCLWAIKPGTEDQFVDGDFIRKNGQGNTRRRGKGSPSSAEQKREEIAKPEAQDLLRDAAAVALTKASHAAARSASPSGHSAKSNSPTPSVYSNATSVHAGSAAANAREYARAPYSPAPSTVSARSITPAMASPAASVSQLEPPVQITFAEPVPAIIPRPASAAAVSIYGGPLVPPQTQLAPPAMLCRSQSSMGFLERNTVIGDPSTAPTATDIEVENDVKPRLEPPAQLSRTASMPMVSSRSAPSAFGPPPASPPQHRLIPHEPLLSTTMSPPTSVYQRLAGPYQPLAYGSTSLHSHRALALLSSPEAAGIMPGRGSPNRPRLLPTGTVTGSPPSPATAAATFTTAGGPARKRTRTDSQREYGMLSPTALVHLSSPVSSVRGGARTPMSPMQDKQATFADPEKRTRRVTGTRLLPAVNALASSDSDPFRSPPPSSASSMSAAAFGSAKYHLRSPSARLQAALSTPGGTKGRVPLGFSPSLATGASWERSTAGSSAASTTGTAAPHGAHGSTAGHHDDSAAAWSELYGGPVDTELEHFGRRAGTRSVWPSPGGNTGHLAW
ncbi:hypothetical protein JCM10908_004044 [Rhodotorula pacifica]|uniref:uncharacterized protein n=1 Tax=Rhodotorula pacifica TaxID=1495444 RepID=UPI003178D7F2